MKIATNALKTIALVIAAASLSGCMAHLTKQQCSTINWYQRGFDDGSQGKYQRNLSRDIQDCAKFNLTVKTKQYAKGWRAGTRQYCQPNTAYQLGANGRSYPHVCPSDLTTQFNRAWRRGLRRYCIPSTGYNLGRTGKPFPTFCGASQVVSFRNAYQSGYRRYQATRNVRSQIDNTNRQISSVRNNLQGKRNKINTLRGELQSGTDQHGNHLTRPNRHEVKMQIRYLYNDVDGLRDQLDRLNDQLNRLQRQYTNLKAS